MSDRSHDSDKQKFFMNANGMSCIPCRRRRQSCHKETKTVKKRNIITTNVIEDRHNLRFGCRHVSPDENSIFKTDKHVDSVETCSIGFVTLEECEQRIEENTTEFEVIKKDIERIQMKLMDVI